MESEQAIVVRGLRKSYDGLEAVKGIDFHVDAGEVFGLLGPNGAGKTTTVEILEGLRPRSAGDVTVLGFDPERQTLRLKDRIGVALQATNLPDKITLREALGAVVLAAAIPRAVERFVPKGPPPDAARFKVVPERPSGREVLELEL